MMFQTIIYACIFQGAYKGAYIGSELVAAGIAILIFYFAYTAKGKLLA